MFDMWDKLIFVLIIILPFQFATNIFSGADVSLFRILILLVFLFWLFTSLKEKHTRIFPRGGLLWFFLAIGAIIGSMVVAPHLDWALRKGFFLINFLIWYGTLSFLVLEKRVQKESLIQGMIFSGTSIALVGIFQWLGQFVFGLETTLFIWREYIAPFFLGGVFSETVLEYSSWLVNVGGITIFRAIAVFPDPHVFAFFLEVCFPWALFLFLKEKKKIYLVAALFMVLAIFLSFSRGAYIGLFVGFLVIGAIFVRDRLLRFREGLFALTCLVCMVGVTLGTNNFVRDRLESTLFSVDASGEERLFLWGQAWDVVTENPFLGVGLGGYPETVQPSATYRDPIYAHDLYLDIATEMGFAGLALWVIGMVWAMRRSLLLAKKDVVFFAGAVSLITFSVHAIFDTPIYSVHVAGILCVVGAILWSDVTPINKTQDEKNS